MSKHTPGPWGRSKVYPIFIVSSEDQHLGIAFNAAPETPPEDEAVANAALMAASPDLADALLGLLARWYDNEMDVDGGPDGYRCNKPEEVDAAEDAYIKAHGMEDRDAYERAMWLEGRVYERIESDKAERLVGAADHERDLRQER